MDLDTDMVHVTIRDNKEPYMRFDSSCYVFDKCGKKIGKIYLVKVEETKDYHWVYKSDGGSVEIKGFSLNDVEGILRTERLVVEFYLAEGQNV